MKGIHDLWCKKNYLWNEKYYQSWYYSCYVKLNSVRVYIFLKSGFLGLKCLFVLTATRDMISQKFKLWQSKNALRKLVVPRSRWKSVSTLASFPKIWKYKEVKTHRLREASFNDLKNPLKFPGSIICCRCFIYISSTKKMIFNLGEFQKT